MSKKFNGIKDFDIDTGANSTNSANTPEENNSINNYDDFMQENLDSAKNTYENTKNNINKVKNTPQNIKNGINNVKGTAKIIQKTSTSLSTGGKKLVQVGAKGAKLLGKAAQVAGKALLATLKWLLVALGPWVLGIICLIILFAIFFDLKGPSQQYRFEQTNNKSIEKDSKKSNSVYGVAQNNDMTDPSIAQRNFYRFFANNSYWKIVAEKTFFDEDTKEVKGEYIKENFKTENRKQGTGAGEDVKIKDYYNRESVLKLPNTLLYSLDDKLFKDIFRYPEQFIQPIKLPLDEEINNLDDLKLELIINEDNVFDTLSWGIDPDTSVRSYKPEDRIKSVSQHGLAPVFTYFQDTKKEIQKAKVSSFTKVEFGNSPSEFKEITYYCADSETEIPHDAENIVTGDPCGDIEVEYKVEDIYIMEKAVTSVGEWKWDYKRDLRFLNSLENRISQDKFDITNEFVLSSGTHCYEYEPVETYECGVNPDTGETLICQKPRVCKSGMSKSWQTTAKKDGAIYEEIAVPQTEHREDKGINYILEYITFFEAQVDVDVATKEDLLGRTGNLTNSNITVGEKKISSNIEIYRPIIQSLLEEWKVSSYMDVDMILAIIQQESGGNPNIANGGGLMQLDWPDGLTKDGTLYKCFKHPQSSIGSSVANSDKGDTFRNGTLCSGISFDGRTQVEQNIRVGVAQILGHYFDEDLGWNGETGDIAKALQSYNCGKGTLLYIKENFPYAWDTSEWMAYRDIARYEVLVKKEQKRGDGWYVEHVTRYYPNDPTKLFYGQLQLLEATDDDTLTAEDDPGLGFFGQPETNVKSWGEGFMDWLKGVLDDIFEGVSESLSKLTSKYKLNTPDTKLFLYKGDLQPKDAIEILTATVSMDERERYNDVDWEDRKDKENIVLYFWESTFQIPMGVILDEKYGGNYQNYDPNSEPTYISGSQGSYMLSNRRTYPTNGRVDFVSKFPELADVQSPTKYNNSTPRITSGYGSRNNPTGNGQQFHPAIDIGAEVPNGNTSLYAPVSGKVVFVGDRNNGFGGMVVIEVQTAKGPVQFFHTHMRAFGTNIKVGTEVVAGQYIGEMGGKSGDPMKGSSTGRHLHFEIRYNSATINPLHVLPKYNINGKVVTQ